MRPYLCSTRFSSRLLLSGLPPYQWMIYFASSCHGPRMYWEPWLMLGRSPPHRGFRFIWDNGRGRTHFIAFMVWNCSMVDWSEKGKRSATSLSGQWQHASGLSLFMDALSLQHINKATHQHTNSNNPSTHLFEMAYQHVFLKNLNTFIRTIHQHTSWRRHINTFIPPKKLQHINP